MKFILNERFTLNEADTFDPRFESNTTPEPQIANQSDNKLEIKDWETEYAKCRTAEDFKRFWHGDDSDPRHPVAGYYESEWGRYAKHIDGLGDTFIETLKTFGWTSEVNPIIAFFKNIISSRSALKLEYITPLDFEILIQALTEHHYIELKEFLTGGKLGIYNLIFNPHFYSQGGNDQLEFLKLQQLFVQAKSAAFNHLGMAFANVYSVDGNQQQLESAIKPGHNLRPLRLVKLDINRITGSSAGTKADNKYIDRILQALPSKEASKKLAAFLYDLFAGTIPEVILQADNDVRTFVMSAKNSANTSAEEIKHFTKLLKLPQVKLDKDKERATELLKRLTDYYNRKN